MGFKIVKIITLIYNVSNQKYQNNIIRTGVFWNKVKEKGEGR